MSAPARKAHNPLSLVTPATTWGPGSFIVVNNGDGGISLGMRYSGRNEGPSASLTPAMARELARDLLERADELEPREAHDCAEGTHWPCTAVAAARESGAI